MRRFVHSTRRELSGYVHHSATPSASAISITLRTLRRLRMNKRRKVGMTPKHAAPSVLGYARATMAGTMGCKTARWSQSSKASPSSDWSLQLDSMKLDSLVMAHQLRRREYVPGPCTHRPSHHESCLHQKALFQPAREKGSKGVGSNWDEVVTR